MYRADFWTLWEKVRVGWSERIALKHVYYQGWNRSPVQVGCMRQVVRAGALGWPRGTGWGGREYWDSGWGTYVNPWLIHVNVWQKPLLKKNNTLILYISISELLGDQVHCHWAVTFWKESFFLSCFPSEVKIIQNKCAVLKGCFTYRAQVV